MLGEAIVSGVNPPFFLLHFTQILFFHMSQASQLGVYKAFVDNYKVALETAEKCSHANSQFQKISEVGSTSMNGQRQMIEY